MTNDTIHQNVVTNRGVAGSRGRILPALVAMLLISAGSVFAQADETPAQKDARIAQLQAQIAQLQAQLNQAQSAPVATTAAPAPATSPAPAATPSTPVATNSPAATDDQTVRMSAFEVRTTQGQGYSQGNSASALKTSEPLMNIPAEIIVVTSDMIKDINSHTATDVLAYAGAVAYYRGPAVLSRGSRIGNPYIDDVPQATGVGVSDNTNIDTIQLVKGPQQVLYPLASLGGIVLENTKKPLPGVTQFTVDETIQQWGRQTFTFDANVPALTHNELQLTARVEGIVQTGSGPFHNARDDRYGIFPSLSLDWKNTTILVQYDAENFRYLPGGTGVLTPSGGVYTGNGRREENTPPNDNDKIQQHDVRLAWTQRISENWQVKTQGTYFNVYRYGSAGFPTTVNWNTNTLTYTIRKDDAYNANLTVQSDVSGRYSIGNFPLTTAFGFNTGDQLIFSKYLATVPTVTVPIGNLAAINAIVFPPPSSYPLPASGNPGSRTEQYVTNGYFTQTLDVIPNWLTLVGGVTFSKIETVTDTNISFSSPYTATDANGHRLLHRFGAVLHVTKAVSAYVSEATTFNPAVGVTFNNTPLPPVVGKSDEVGIKVSFMDGKISASAAAFKMTLSNQAILAAYPALNIAGLNYYNPIGTTTTHGWDASLVVQPLPGLEAIATAYMGTVRDQNNNPVSGTYESSWSVFGKYSFENTSPLNGFYAGGGAQRAGGKWFTMSGLVLPGGAPLPVNSSGTSVFKLRQDVLLNAFVGYKFNRHWDFRVFCENVLNKAYPIGAQGVGLVDPVDPRTFSVEGTFHY